MSEYKGMKEILKQFRLELKNELLNDNWPVNSIYLSLSSTNPKNLFGGEWDLLSDRFLIGAGGTYTAGATGGNKTVTLEYGNLPPNVHTTDAGTDGQSYNLGGVGQSLGRKKGGTTTPLSIMPPYLAVYMWKRRA